jgi:hypothetical protein
MLVIIIGPCHLLYKLHEIKYFNYIISFTIFFYLVAAYTAFLFLTLFYAISWQIRNLYLILTVWQLIILLSVAGGVLSSGVFYRIIPLIRQPRHTSLIGVVALTIGASLLFPLTWLGFLPFYALGQYPEVKAVVLQFNELTRVDATFAREVADVLGLDKWIHIGQRPPQNNTPHPWPQPWELRKFHPSRLPADFNLLIVIVDALRGDAINFAGYHRNLTLFLNRWAREEGISFRRAYSQGGGSFAALPFLVGGRSRY